MRLVASLACVLFISTTTAAFAQPSSGTVFISGSGFAAVEKSPTSSGLGAPDSDTSGTVAGGALGIGVHLTEKVSARFEWSLTDELRQSRSFGYPFYPPELLAAVSGLGGIVRPGDLGISIVPANYQTKRKTAAGFALLGYHLTAGRASIEILGGLGLVNTDETTSYDVRIARGLTLPAQPEYSNSSYHPVAVVGADVAVSLTAHAAIVPQVRAYALNGGLSLRPGLGLRWTF